MSDAVYNVIYSVKNSIDRVFFYTASLKIQSSAN